MLSVGPFFVKCMEKVRPKVDDCRDAGGRATQDAVAEKLVWAMHKCSDYRDVKELPISRDREC